MPSPSSARPSVNAPNTHTILLMQPEQARQSRTFYDFSTLRLALTGLTEIFQEILRRFNPGKKELSYTMADLHRYIDSVPDLSMLVYDAGTRQYQPLTKQAVKGLLQDLVTNGGGKK